MNFDKSKENIQPIRGGRNVHQLNVALQAEHSAENQQMLLLQRQEFENAIRNYTGDDALNNYYHYICWAEQSYPKHGHEGNLKPLLEDCLSKFENNPRYINDPRFCKLWIKFIDMQQNPLELYSMLYARGICKVCAEFYKAWAYYFEAAGDFNNANIVFQTGIKELAQPMQSLLAAQESMIFSAGHQQLYGVDEQRLRDQRAALTSLKPFRSGRVASVRVPSGSGAGVLPSTAINVPKSNVPVQVYYNENDIHLGVAGAAAPPPTSVLAAAKKDAVKENFMKAGPWNAGKKFGPSSVTHKTIAFPIHDDDDSPEIVGIRLPLDHAKVCNQDLSNWKPPICLPDPDDPTKISVYCKKRVYIDPTTEYSMEEIRAKMYIKKYKSRLNAPTMETEQAIQSIMGDNEQLGIQEIVVYEDETEEAHTSNGLYAQQFGYVQPTPMEKLHQSSHHSEEKTLLQLSNASQQTLSKQDPFQYSAHHPMDLNPVQTTNQSVAGNQENLQYEETHQNSELWNSAYLCLGDNWGKESAPFQVYASPEPQIAQISKLQHESCAGYEEKQLQGNAMKTPLKILNDDDLAETGSRGGLDVEAAAQPTDGAKRSPMFDSENSNDPKYQLSETTLEDFAFNAFYVSTPLKKLSLIPEERTLVNSEGSGGSSGINLTQKSLYSSLKPNVVESEKERSYQENLAQNMKANEALRFELWRRMECDNEVLTTSHTTQSPTPLRTPDSRAAQIYNKTIEFNDQSIQDKVHTPYPVLDCAPLDPFSSAEIKRLLSHVGFPGRHTDGYVYLNSAPRVAVKKEPCYIGRDKFIVEKSLAKGNFGSVFKACNLESGEHIALKVQKNPNKWEFYICRELQFRLDKELRHKFMNVRVGYFCDSMSIFLSDFSSYGSLLDVINQIRIKTQRAMRVNLCLHFTIEMLNIIQALHKAKIIHADIKPDNFLLLLKNNSFTLQLIDFGCSIDMSLYPEGTLFTRKINTDSFTCCEMLDGRPWSYHTDLFCIAASTHVMLFDKYIELKKQDQTWCISQKITRYMQADCWNMFFSTLLNMQEGLPDVESLKQFLNGYLRGGQLAEEMREVVNIVRNR